MTKTLEELWQDTSRKHGWEYCLTNIAHFFYVPQVCEKCFVTSRAEEVMREGDIHHTRSIKTNSAVTLSRKPGLDLCCDLLQHSQGVPRTCSFYIIIRISILLVPSLHSLLTFNNIMHILPLHPCGLYSIRAQHSYGQHRPCKIVLSTLVAPRGVTDLYLS